MEAVELYFIPAPAIGHIISTIKLAKLVIERNEVINVTVLIINLPTQLSNVEAYVKYLVKNNPCRGRMTFVVFDANDVPYGCKAISHVMEFRKTHVEYMIRQMISNEGKKPGCFMLDIFSSCMVEVADKLCIPSYLYFTSGANVLNFYFYAQSKAKRMDIVEVFNDPTILVEVDGFKNPIRTTVIPSVFQDKDVCQSTLNIVSNFKKMRGILVNSYMELESAGIDALLRGADHGENPRVYPVGPILELDFDNRAEASKVMNSRSVMQWLDSQPQSSVVFLCFGSIATLSKEQVAEIATGLEISGHRYLWTLPHPDAKDTIFLEALPQNFVNRMGDRGRIISWAPQIKILSHPSIGGFLSHCGWNSTLESLWFGVPMATWPVFAEQQLNAFLAVKEWNLAVEITIDNKKDWQSRKCNKLIKAEDIERGIRNLMTCDEKMRGRVTKMGEEGKKTMEEGGTSYTYLTQFISDVLNF